MSGQVEGSIGHVITAMENAARHISAKFDLAAQLARRLNHKGRGARPRIGVVVAESDAPEFSALETEVISLQQRYLLATAALFIVVTRGETGREDARESFHQIVAAEGFVSELDTIVARAERGAGLARDVISLRRAKKGGARPTLSAVDHVAAGLAAQYHACFVDCAAACVNDARGNGQLPYDICPECLIPLSVNAEHSELECTECGLGRMLMGTVFDDSQYYNQEGQKAKSGLFNPNRHYRFWMDHIQAREPEEEIGNPDDSTNVYGETLVARLRGIIARGTKIGRSDLNKNIPLLLKLLTGVGPPALPESICQRVEKIFSQAIEIGERVRPAGRTNRNYYPYYIFKILDAVLPANDRSSRGILFYIYLQGKETVDKNDREWEETCAELPDITWVPTDRALGQKYAPF
jgi:hypothetical protein